MITPPASPRVSVVLPVYNGARDVPAAVQSILAQTFTDFELIAINDGSTKDNSREVLDGLAESTRDPRLRVVHLDANVGLARALNHGIGLASGAFIVRQDQDDISRPERIARQLAFMQTNPRCGLLGTAAEIWIGDEPSGRFHDHAGDNAMLQVDLLSNNPFVHSSVMLRRSALDEVGLYTTDRARQPPEDYELWSRIARRHQVANLPDRLLVYREVPGSMSRDAANPFLQKLIVISAENIAFWNGLAAPDQTCRAAACLLHAAYDLLPAEADIETICGSLTAAITAIEAANPGAELAERKARVLANLCHHFVQAGRLPTWLEPLVGPARRLPLPAGLKRRVVAWLSR